MAAYEVTPESTTSKTPSARPMLSDSHHGGLRLTTADYRATQHFPHSLGFVPHSLGYVPHSLETFSLGSLRSEIRRTSFPSEIQQGASVHHPHHGTGTIVNVSNKLIDVDFNDRSAGRISFDLESAAALTPIAVNSWWGNFESSHLELAYNERREKDREEIAKRVLVPIAFVGFVFMVVISFQMMAFDYDQHLLWVQSGAVKAVAKLHAGYGVHVPSSWLFTFVLCVIGLAGSSSWCVRGKRGAILVSAMWQVVCFYNFFISFLDLMYKPNGDPAVFLPDISAVLTFQLGMLCYTPTGLLRSQHAILNGIAVAVYGTFFLVFDRNLEILHFRHLCFLWMITIVGARAAVSIEFQHRNCFLKEYLKDAKVSASTQSVLKDIQAKAASNESTTERDALIAQAQREHRWMVRDSDVVKEHKLGEGQFGDVMKARYHNTTVAVKTGKEIRMDAFSTVTEEFLMHVSIAHPCIVQVLGACVEPVSSTRIQFSIIVEYMSYGALSDILHNPVNGAQLSVIDKLQAVLAVSLGVEHLHCTDPSILHCDLKPDNVLVGSGFVCKIADLGASRYTHKPRTHVGAPMSLLYASPSRCQAKLVKHNTAICRADDVWSFGVLLFEVLSQREAFYWEFESKVNPISSVLDFTQRCAANLISIAPPQCHEEGTPGLDPFHDVVLASVWDNIGIQCMSFDAETRPAMKDVAVYLTQTYNTLLKVL